MQWLLNHSLTDAFAIREHCRKAYSCEAKSFSVMKNANSSEAKSFCVMSFNQKPLTVQYDQWLTCSTVGLV